MTKILMLFQNSNGRLKKENTGFMQPDTATKNTFIFTECSWGLPRESKWITKTEMG